MQFKLNFKNGIINTVRLLTEPGKDEIKNECYFFHNNCYKNNTDPEAYYPNRSEKCGWKSKLFIWWNSLTPSFHGHLSYTTQHSRTSVIELQYFIRKIR